MIQLSSRPLVNLWDYLEMGLVTMIPTVMLCTCNNAIQSNRQPSVYRIVYMPNAELSIYNDDLTASLHKEWIQLCGYMNRRVTDNNKYCRCQILCANTTPWKAGRHSRGRDGPSTAPPRASPSTPQRRRRRPLHRQHRPQSPLGGAPACGRHSPGFHRGP